MASCEALPKVLVIDDERGPRESLRILLKNDYCVLCAESVNAGLELIKQNVPEAVVMDIRMPLKNGLDGLREIRQLDPDVSVIMLTGFGTLESAQEAIRLGANDYVRKPFDAREMEAVIGRNVHRTQLERRRSRAEQELAKLNQRLLEEMSRKDRLVALGQQSAELMHDLRSPLSSVMGYVELLASELRESREGLGEHWQETHEYLEMIERSVVRCKELADMWLHGDKNNGHRMRPMLICELIGDVVRSLKQAAVGRGVRIDCQVGAVDCEIVADGVQIFRALQNVVMNAIEAVPANAGVVRICCIQNGTHALVKVDDNGCGMAPDQMEHAFEPYFTTKQYTGTGLGLFITKRIVEEHHGSIMLQSQPNQGTSISIRLPLSGQPEIAIA
ncbi:MAG: hybrid sensor histidine kinase/response regulator [Verrucomicrobiota bacterium]